MLSRRSLVANPAVLALAVGLAAGACSDDSSPSDPAAAAGAGPAAGSGGAPSGPAPGAGAPGGPGAGSAGRPDDGPCEASGCNVPIGLPEPLAGVYVDKGVADQAASFRALAALPLRDVDGLRAEIAAMYDPASPSFRAYQTPEQFLQKHGPPPEQVEALRAWLAASGLEVARVAANRMLVEFRGTVAAFDAAFQTQLHLFERKNPLSGGAPIDVYGVLPDERAVVPHEVGAILSAVLSCDVPAEQRTPPADNGNVDDAPPPAVGGVTPAQIAAAYGADPLYDAGTRGQGVRLGVIVGGEFKRSDAASFWKAFGIERAAPTAVVTGDTPARRVTETTLDVEWSGALAPGADVLVYQGADARNTSMIFAFNEAIGRAEASVLTDSFAHREDSEDRTVRLQYDASAMQAAALGISVVSASGDSGEPDVPAVSPYVTAVGGTYVTLDAQGALKSEDAWSASGSGYSLTLPMPPWQAAVADATVGKRATADLALNAGTDYWVYYLGDWRAYGGTSFASPVFAGLLALVNNARAGAGKPPAGLLGPLLYQNPAVRATFRDIVSGSTQNFSAGPGWDMPTGWGAPDAAALARALP
jgi:kumamolisin